MPETACTAISNVPVRLITLRSSTCTAVLSDLGARLLEFHVPDRDGHTADVVLGRATPEDTFTDRHYMGATAGRYAGRIARGQFTLDGQRYQLAANEGENHLHGGVRGFDQYFWTTTLHRGEEAVTFTRVSADGEEGFPGELTARTTYRLEGQTLSISMTATTDQATIVRLVNHAYWNLGGHDSGPILDHLVQLNASHYIVTDEELLPTGEIASVHATPFDFRKPRAVGDRNADVVNNGAGRVSQESAGYDNSWVLDGAGFRVVGSVTDPRSGRRLELGTDQPGLCLYAGGYLAGLSAKGSLSAQGPLSAKGPLRAYPQFAGLTLETTAFPDDINQPHFPSPVLRPGDTYRNEMQLAFSTI